MAINPIAWQAPAAPGFTGVFTPNAALQAIKYLDIAGEQGPEAVVMGPDQYLYTATHDGWIVRLRHSQPPAERWLNTQGRPLGLAFDEQGNLLVADAYRGLLSISPDKTMTLLSQQAASTTINYANDLAVAKDGRVFFSDASVKFSARANGGTYPASLLDLMEHGGHGRLLMYNPDNQQTTELMTGLNFANGVALDPKEQFILINETGHYRVHKYWLRGNKAGSSEVLIENLPGFPDNIAAGLQGKFWLGLASPRNTLLDQLADKPWLRKLVQRLPAWVRPKATHYGHVIAIDADGAVLQSLQDPAGAYPITTGVAETRDNLYISSLIANKLGWLANPSSQSPP